MCKKILPLIITLMTYQCWEIGMAYPVESGFMTITRAKVLPKIDGRLDDAAWKHVSRTELLWDASDKILSESIQTEVMAIYDDTALYVALLNKDPDTANLQASSRDRGVRGDDSVGIFIDVGNTRKGPSFSITVNAANATYCTWMASSALEEKARNGEILTDLIPIALAYPKNSEWDPKGVKTATHIDRQLWVAEVKIPFEDLLVSAVPKGQTWGANFVRHIPGWEDVWATWSKAGWSFYKPEKFGALAFSE